MDFAKKHSTSIAGVIVVALAFFSLGSHHGKNAAMASAAVENIKNAGAGQPTDVDFAAFWKAWTILKKDYVPTATSTKPVTDQDKVWGAISGMTASLGDPYTVF